MEPTVERFLFAFEAYCRQPPPKEDPPAVEPSGVVALQNAPVVIPITKPIESEGKTREQEYYTELKKLFGTGFCGFEEVTQAFKLQDERMLVSFDDCRTALTERLWEKCQEPDVAVFLGNIKAGIIDASDWILILRERYLSFFEAGRGTLCLPISMKELQDHIAPDMVTRNQGKLLWGVDWYPEELFYTGSGISLHWKFVTKRCVEGTKGKKHGEQTPILNAYAQQVGFDPGLTRRRIPCEVVYDHAVTLRAHTIRLLEGEYDWTDTRTSNGNFVDVGRGDASGLRVYGYSADDSGGYLGACLSR